MNYTIDQKQSDNFVNTLREQDQLLKKTISND